MALDTDGATAPSISDDGERRRPTDKPLRRLHHVTRIDIEPSEDHPRRHPTHGWQVRARRDGQRVSKFFADAKHGGREPALEAALEHRDNLLAAIPDGPTKPRRAWSNTGVVGLSVREKGAGPRAKLNVQLNWVDAGGRRRAGSFSVEKWGLRRALWNGCLRLYRERKAAGAPVEEPHVMFARAQEPFQDQIAAEIAEEQAAERARAEAEAAAERKRERAELARGRFASQAERVVHEEAAVQRLEEVLFG